MINALTMCFNQALCSECIQFVHVGTSDRSVFSSIISTDDGWCDLKIEDPFDTVAVVKQRIDFETLSKINKFIAEYSLARELPDGPYSGYKITTLDEQNGSVDFFIFSSKENEDFFSALIEWLRKENSNNELIDFVFEIKRRGYFFYG